MSLSFIGALLVATILAIYEFLSTKVMKFHNFTLLKNEYLYETFNYIYNVNDLIRWINRIFIEFLLINAIFVTLKCCDENLFHTVTIIIIGRVVPYTIAQYLFRRIAMRPKD